jgi:hypothetical protein
MQYGFCKKVGEEFGYSRRGVIYRTANSAFNKLPSVAIVGNRLFGNGGIPEMPGDDLKVLTEAESDVIKSLILWSNIAPLKILVVNV